ncbi:MAG: AAA family ATPase [bacterium]|nr:AAA family ATPase [bacterium]
MNKKLIVGLVGEKGGGKGTFVDLLKELNPTLKIDRFRSSDILNETLKVWDISSTRENLSKLAVSMDQTYGLGTLTHAMEQMIKNSQAEVVFFDGVRWKTDVKMLKKFPQSLIVYVTANPQLRYERTKARKEKAGEDKTNFEQFMEEEKAHTEVFISQIGASADFTITNEESLEEFKTQVQQFIKQYLSH